MEVSASICFIFEKKVIGRALGDVCGGFKVSFFSNSKELRLSPLSGRKKQSNVRQEARRALTVTSYQL